MAHVSEGGVSMTAFVEASCRFQTLMKLSKEDEAAYVPVLSTAIDTTPSAWPASVLSFLIPFIHRVM